MSVYSSNREQRRDSGIRVLCPPLCHLSQGPAPGATVVWPPILLLFNGFFFFLDLFCYHVYDTYMFCLHVCLLVCPVPSEVRRGDRCSETGLTAD